MDNNTDVILDVKNLCKEFPVENGVFSSHYSSKVSAVQDVSFAIRRGETLGLVGESGCGKSTTAAASCAFRSAPRVRCSLTART